MPFTEYGIFISRQIRDSKSRALLPLMPVESAAFFKLAPLATALRISAFLEFGTIGHPIDFACGSVQAVVMCSASSVHFHNA